MRVEKPADRTVKPTRHLPVRRSRHTGLLTQMTIFWSKEASVQDRETESGSDSAQWK